MPRSSSRNAIAVAVAVLVFAIVFLEWRGAARGPLRIDEAHKIADTHFFRLLLDGDFDDPSWTGHIVDRTNPPAGKFVFGFAAWIAGAPLASSLSIRIEEADGKLGQQLQPGALPQYQNTLRAMRRASLCATALTAAILAFAATRLHSAGAGLLAAALHFFSYLPQTFAATAVYDPLLTLFVAATILPIVAMSPVGRRTPADPSSPGSGSIAAPAGGRPEAGAPRGYMLGAIGGILSALAFQTRLSGGVALVAFCVAALLLAPRAVPVAIAVCAAVSFALNPLYWRGGFLSQISDLRVLLERQHGLDGVPARIGFSWEILGGDIVGLAALFGTCLALLFLVPNGARERGPFVIAAAWSLTLVLPTVLWLPVAWPRYLLVTVPPLSLLAGLGWSELAGQLVAALRRKH